MRSPANHPQSPSPLGGHYYTDVEQIDTQRLEQYSNVPGVARVFVTPEMVANPPKGAPMPLRAIPGSLTAFTPDDAIAYFEAHPFIAGWGLPGTTIVMTRLEFLPREAAEQAIRASFKGRVAPGGIVCLMQFAGTFSLAGIGTPPMVRGGAGGMGYTHATHLAFDALTGKALTWGFLTSSGDPY